MVISPNRDNHSKLNAITTHTSLTRSSHGWVPAAVTTQSQGAQTQSTRYCCGWDKMVSTLHSRDYAAHFAPLCTLAQNRLALVWFPAIIFFRCAFGVRDNLYLIFTPCMSLRRLALKRFPTFVYRYIIPCMSLCPPCFRISCLYNAVFFGARDN